MADEVVDATIEQTQAVSGLLRLRDCPVQSRTANLNQELPLSAQALDHYESTSSTASPSLLGDDDWDELDRQLQIES